MKVSQNKKITTLIIIALLLILTLLAGCKKNANTPNNGDNKNNKNNTENTDSTKNTDNTDNKNNADNTGTSPALQAIVDEAQGQLAALRESSKDMMTIDIVARGNSLVYVFKYVIDVGSKVEVAEGLKSGIESNASVYEGVLGSLKAANITNPSVIIEYLDKDGGMLYSREFK